jgi:transposase InsO family protein
MESVKLVKGGQTIVFKAELLDFPKANRCSWVKFNCKGKLKAAGDKLVNPEQMDKTHLRILVYRVWKEMVAYALRFHSGRGSPYCSLEYQGTLAGDRKKSSMNRKGDCWDNVLMESQWYRQKVGRLYGEKVATRRDPIDEVIDWLSFYNHRLLHSTLGYFRPMQLDQLWGTAQHLKVA